MPWIEYVVFHGGGHQSTTRDYQWVETANKSTLAGFREELMDRFDRYSGPPIIKTLRAVRTLPGDDWDRMMATAEHRVKLAQEDCDRVFFTPRRRRNPTKGT